MKPLKIVLSFLFTLFAAGLVGTVVEANTGWDAGYVAIGLLALSLIPVAPVQGSLHDEVVRNIFGNMVARKLFPNNGFMEGVMVDNELDSNNKNFEIPQESETPEIVENPTAYPLQTKDTENTKKTYTADVIATLPQRIGDFERLAVSYNRMEQASTLHARTLNNRFANKLLYKWAPTVAAQIKRTSGSGAAANNPHSTATGTRKAVQEADIHSIVETFLSQDVPIEGSRIVIPPKMYTNLLALSGFVDADKVGLDNVPSVRRQGFIGMIYGFEVYVRSTSVLYTNAGTPVPKAPTAADATTDNLAAIAYHPDFVRMGQGPLFTYINENQGSQLGSTINYATSVGGTQSYTDQQGVVALVQAAG